MAIEQLKLQNQLCFRLYTASRLITQAYEPFFKPLGITYTQYLVLIVLWEKDDQPVNDIAKKLKLGLNTVSPLIRRMEKFGILSRHGSDSDKRQQLVFLTEKGKDLQNKCESIPNCMVDLLKDCDICLEKLISMIPVLDELINKLGGNE